MKKIGFIYLDEPYNIYHSLSIAIELIKSKNISVSILCTERNLKAITEIIDIKNIDITVLRPHWHFTLPHYIEIKLQFRYLIFSRYKKLLSSFDAIVCSLYNDLLLRRFLAKQSITKLIFAGHGVANRSYSYDDKIKQFDYILLAGKKEEAIRKSLNQLSNIDYTVIGYVKYDICKSLSVHSPFTDDKPIVFYNPHWLRESSSYYDHGYNILEQFSNQNKYNLIFAQHSLLTTRNKSIIKTINKFKDYPNIHIDLGSHSCHNMTYLKLSDIYLGDISSQALEFLLHKLKPCIFIDINDLKETEYEYHTWLLGDVIDNTNNIIDKLRHAIERHNTYYKEVQKEEIKSIFFKDKISATEIAAKGIENYLSKN